MVKYKSSSIFHRRRKYDGIISQVAKYEEYNSRVGTSKKIRPDEGNGRKKSWKIGLLFFKFTFQSFH